MPFIQSAAARDAKRVPSLASLSQLTRTPWSSLLVPGSIKVFVCEPLQPWPLASFFGPLSLNTISCLSGLLQAPDPGLSLQLGTGGHTLKHKFRPRVCMFVDSSLQHPAWIS